MASRPARSWNLADRSLELGSATCLMAVLNLTSDSFYVASRLPDARAALAHAEEALEAGADILDLGAESTRPGSRPLSAEEEQARLLPALDALHRHFPQALLSVDTRHAATAVRALDAGAAIVNDVTGLEDPEMADVLATRRCGLVLMHRRGDFATMQSLPPLSDPVATVDCGFEIILDRVRAAGIAPERVVLDPGFGFGKNLDENFPLLAEFKTWHRFGRPLLVGLSRKSFIGKTLGGVLPEDRLFGSLAATTAAVLAGTHIVRTHDVAPTRQALRVADAILAARS